MTTPAGETPDPDPGADRAPDRSGYPTAKRHLHDPEDEAWVRSLSPAERIEMVWPLTLQAWGFKEGLTEEPRLRRDIVRVVRGKRKPENQDGHSTEGQGSA